MNKEIMDHWIKKAKQTPRTVAFPEATEEKILRAAEEAGACGAIIPMLVGNEVEIKKAAEAFGISLTGMKIVQPDAVYIEQRAEKMAESRPDLKVSSICRKCRDNMYFAFLLQAVGEADCVFAGMTHTTGEVILAAQMMIGFAKDISTISSMGIMDIPGYSGENGTLIAFADSAVCASPNSEELADIAISTCDTVKSLLEWEPRCALLSFSTKGSAEHMDVKKVSDAVIIANRKRPDLMIDGEFQLDAAISPEVAAKKVKTASKVAGHANIIIYPDLSAGNIGVKLVQQFAHGDAYGPTLQGFAKPVSDCSRGAPVSELLGNIIMLAVRTINSN